MQEGIEIDYNAHKERIVYQKYYDDEDLDNEHREEIRYDIDDDGKNLKKIADEINNKINI